MGSAGFEPATYHVSLFWCMICMSNRPNRKKLLDNGVEEKCVCCGLNNQWNGRDIKLHIDHINGDRGNNDVSNLRFLCPNCHSQTDTYCGRNIGLSNIAALEALSNDDLRKFIDSHKWDDICSLYKISPQTLSRFLKRRGMKKMRVGGYWNKVERPSRETLLLDISSMSMTSVGKKYGVSDNAIRKWCRSYGILDRALYRHDKSKIGSKF